MLILPNTIKLPETLKVVGPEIVIPTPVSIVTAQ